MSVQPPFLFSNEVLSNSTEELSHKPNLLGIQTPIISLLKKPSSNSISSEHEKTFIEIINHNIEIIEEKNEVAFLSEPGKLSCRPVSQVCPSFCQILHWSIICFYEQWDLMLSFAVSD